MGSGEYIGVGILLVLVVGILAAVYMYPKLQAPSSHYPFNESYGVTITKGNGIVIYEIPHFDRNVSVSPIELVTCNFKIAGERIVRKCVGKYYIAELGKGDWAGPAAVVSVIDLKSMRYVKYLEIYGMHGNEVIENVTMKNSTIHIKRVPLKLFFPSDRTISLIRNNSIEFRIKIVYDDSVSAYDKYLPKHLIINATWGWCILLSKVTGLLCDVKVVNDSSWNVKFVVTNKWGRSEESGKGVQGEIVAIIRYERPWDRGTVWHELGHALGLFDLYYTHPPSDDPAVNELWNASTMNIAGNLTAIDVFAAARNLAFTLSKTNPQLASKVLENLREYGVVNGTMIVVVDDRGNVLFPTWLTNSFGHVNFSALSVMKMIASIYYGTK